MSIIIFLCLGVFTTIDLEYSQYPYVWGSFLWGLGFVYFALNARRSAPKILFCNLAVFLFCFGLLETGAMVYFVDHDKYEYSRPDYFVSDDLLGYAPKKNVRVSVRKYRDDQLLYDATYTINKEGLRIAPPFEGQYCKNSILFFGCSFMFGEGLNDDETMPFLVGELSKAKVYNFGFHGYGPHQMLSEIDHGLVDKIVDCKPKYAVYEAAYFHVGRAAGYFPWDRHGPKYILTREGKVKYAGHFDDSPAKRIIDDILGKSAICKNFIEGRYYVNKVNKKDIETYIAIVIAAKNELQKKFPGLEFHVIYWETDEKKDQMILEGFQKEGIKIHLLSDILLRKSNNWKSDYLTADGHPNFTANKTFADYIVRNVMRNPA